MTNEEIRITARRLLASRTSLVSCVPFFSRLLLRLKIGVADCETAYTDMENVVFDPAFASSFFFTRCFTACLTIA